MRSASCLLMLRADCYTLVALFHYLCSGLADWPALDGLGIARQVVDLGKLVLVRDDPALVLAAAL